MSHYFHLTHPALREGGAPYCGMPADAARADATEIGRVNVPAGAAASPVLLDPDLCPCCRHVWTCPVVLTDVQSRRNPELSTCQHAAHAAAVGAVLVGAL